MSDFDPEPYDDLADDDGTCPECGTPSDENCEEWCGLEDEDDED